MFLSHFYLILITIPTRVTQSSATLLDNIYTTDPMSGPKGVLTSDFSLYVQMSQYPALIKKSLIYLQTHPILHRIV